jgi:hypothetical protein
MKTVSLDTKEAPNKWWALQDRRMRNYVNSTLYTEAQRVRMERLRLALELCVRGTVYAVSFGKRSASVKVQAGAVVVYRRELEALEADWTKEGIYKKVSAQGFQYHLTRV